MDPRIGLPGRPVTPVPREGGAAHEAGTVGRQFARLFVKEVLKAAKIAGGFGPLAGGLTAEFYHDLFLDAIAEKIAAADDLGLSRVFAQK